MIAGIGAGALKVSYLDFFFKSEINFRAASQIKAKLPQNASEIQEIITTQVRLGKMNDFIAFQYTWRQFKISHTFLYISDVSHSFGYL